MKKHGTTALALLLCAAFPVSAVAQDAWKFDLKCNTHSQLDVKARTFSDGDNAPAYHSDADDDGILHFLVDLGAEQWRECRREDDPASTNCDFVEIGVWGEHFNALTADERNGLNGVVGLGNDRVVKGGLYGRTLIIHIPDIASEGSYTMESIDLSTNQYTQRSYKGQESDPDEQRTATGSCRVLPFSGDF